MDTLTIAIRIDAGQTYSLSFSQSDVTPEEALERFDAVVAKARRTLEAVA